MGRLDNKIAIVTGSGRGIGKAIALLFAQEGADVVISDVLYDNCLEVKDEVEQLGRKAIAVQCDVGTRKECEELVQKTMDEFRRIDILVNNAGISIDNYLTKLTDEDWNEVMRVDLYGPFVLMQETIKHMMEAKYGRIVNISSVAAIKGVIGGANYAAAKAGLIGLSKTAAREYGRYNICVNVVCPGATKTYNVDKLSEKVQQAMLNTTLLGRFAEPEEMAKVTLFLASEDSSFITGQVVIADGGRYDKL